MNEEDVLERAGSAEDPERDLEPCEEAAGCRGEEDLDDAGPRHEGTRELGTRGEDAAARYLEMHGYTVMERNWRCRFGEVDIIACDEDGTVVFVEVKTRRSIAAGIPEEAVTCAKQRRYERIALCYLVESDWEADVCVRFDCIGICVVENRRALLRHHLGCFDGRF